MMPALAEAVTGPDTFVKGRRTGPSQATHCHSNKPTHTDTSATRARTFFPSGIHRLSTVHSDQPIIARQFSLLHREGT